MQNWLGGVGWGMDFFICTLASFCKTILYYDVSFIQNLSVGVY